MKIKIKNLLATCFIIFSGLYSMPCFATPNNLDDIFNHFINFTQQISSLESMFAYFAGFGFAVSALIKLKRYYDNAQEVHLSAISLESILAICLLLAPSLMDKLMENQHTFKKDVVFLKLGTQNKSEPSRQIMQTKEDSAKYTNTSTVVPAAADDDATTVDDNAALATTNIPDNNTQEAPQESSENDATPDTNENILALYNQE